MVWPSGQGLMSKSDGINMFRAGKCKAGSGFVFDHNASCASENEVWKYFVPYPKRKASLENLFHT